MVSSVKEIKTNHATSILKIIAVVTMVIDHAGAVFFPQYRWLRVIGRIAFPLFAYCIAFGCVATHNIGKYALRVFLMAMCIQPLYVTAMNHLEMLSFDWAHNFYRLDLIFQHYYLGYYHVIHFTLFLGILVLWTIKKKKYLLTALAVAACWYLQSYFDYGMYGIILIVLFYAFLDRPTTSVVWVLAYMVWYGLPSSMQYKLFPLPDQITVKTQLWAIVALPLIYFQMPRNPRVNKWVFYLLYPAHIVVFYIIRLLGR